MKAKILAIIALSLSQAAPVSAQDNRPAADPKACYQVAKQGLEAMLSGKDKLSYEKAIFLIENAWVDNRGNYPKFQSYINSGVARIYTIMTQADDPAPKKTPDNFFDALRQKSKEDQGFSQNAKVNYAIYKYMSDTTYFLDLPNNKLVYHLPYRYAIGDPLGSGNWRNTQVANMLVNGKGNCFAFASLFRIYAERLGSGANICTAPSHIYIRHKDENGTNFNVEVASRAFPGTGTLSTLTYTTQDAIKSGVSLRELDLQQSVALCLVYLAKGYEHKLGAAADDGFMMDCAASALHFDSLNLNAMLLKAELLEKHLLASGKTIAQLQAQPEFKAYEMLLDKLHRLGYREMPLAMKNTLVKGWSRDSVTHLAHKNYLTQPGKNGNQTRYASLSWGLFDEDIADKPTERYGQTLFSTKHHKITGFAKEQTLYNNYSFDPVLFALNVDPLAHKLPSQSPYSAFGNNPIYYVDPDGAFQYPAQKAAAYTKSYPMITKYLANNVQNDVLKSQTVMNGMAKYSEGNLTRAQIEKDTKWGAKGSPTIVFNSELKSDAETGFFGRYDNSTNTINLSKDMADRIEKVLGSDASFEDKQAAMYEFFATVTHEEVHRGDYLDGQRQDASDPSGFGGEPGSAFMGDVFESKDVNVDGEIIRVNTVQSVHGQSKELIQMQKSEGKTDVIPTVPQR
jgi:hypothetical protein